MARMSKITRIIYLTDEIIGSRQPTGWIDRIIKVVADRNVNRVTNGDGKMELLAIATCRNHNERDKNNSSHHRIHFPVVI